MQLLQDMCECDRIATIIADNVAIRHTRLAVSIVIAINDDECVRKCIYISHLTIAAAPIQVAAFVSSLHELRIHSPIRRSKCVPSALAACIDCIFDCHVRLHMRINRH